MRQVLSAAAVVAALGLAAPAFAQATSSEAAPPADASADAKAGASAEAAAPSAAQAGANASVTAGMTVKDKTGASIGQVADVKTDGGKTMATIKMGAETFAVDAANLGVADGSATINATQAEIQSMLKK
jgi:hypothetical protein